MKMSDSMHKLNGVIEHYKRHINRATEANDNDKLMKCISKLSRLPITVQNLQKTGIGRVVNSLRKYDGNIGESAKGLVVNWKNVVKIEESENFYQRGENSDEEHISSTNDNDELQINQNITSSVASTSYYNNNDNKSNAPELNNVNNDYLSDHEPSHNRHHDKSKYKRTKKDKESKKRKESISTSTDDQGEGHVSKKRRYHKYQSSKTETEYDKSEVTKLTHHNINSTEMIKKDKKISHSNKKKDKHKSESRLHKNKHESESKSHKDKHESESKSHKDKHESESKSHKDKYESKPVSNSTLSHKDKSDSKKRNKEKHKEESKPSTSATTSTTTSSSKTFEEALLGILQVGNKKQVKSKCREKSSRSSSSERDSSPIPTMKLAPLNLDPEELIANYKPLPQLDVKKKKTIDDVDPLASIMTTKNIRTKVFSGNKSMIYSEVPSLVDFCVKTIKENLDALEFTGGVPYSILEPILKHATPDQLYSLEHYNDYLIEETGILWEYHCKKEFRNKIPEKHESWRDCYLRCLEERETKLAKLRQNINANQAASTPVRKTQLAYVDTAVKPPRGIARKQAKFHTATDNKRNILNKSMMGGNSTAEVLSANNRSTTMATGIPIALNSAHSQSSAVLKKKKAPLMQKALQLIKSTRRR